MRIKRFKVFQNPMSGAGSRPSSVFIVKEYRQTKKGLKKNSRFKFWLNLSKCSGFNPVRIKFLKPLEV